MDVYVLVGLGLACFPIGSWIILSYIQSKRLYDGLLRVQILSIRTAMMLPSYACLIWLTLLIPKSAALMAVPIAIAEGFSFYSFFAMLIANLGGGNNALQELISHNNPPCGCFTNVDYRGFYARVQIALYQFLFVRPLLELAAAIFSYMNYRVPSLLCTIGGTAQFLWGFIYLVTFYQTIYNLSENLFATLKILLLKVSVGLYITQGVVVEILTATGTLDMKDTSRYDSEERLTRGLALLVLAEYFILSTLLYFAFSHHIQPNFFLVHSYPQSTTPVKMTYYEFLTKVFTFSDVFQELTPTLAYSDDMDRTSSAHERLLPGKRQQNYF